MITHKPIQLKNLGLSFPHKNCFDDFNTQILFGSRIAIVGRNGSGKSSLLKILSGAFEATSGEIQIPGDVCTGYVPQVIEDFEVLSGGERINAKLTESLSQRPNLLLLDEPTNHLDLKNRKSMLRMLQAYTGTLVLVSHDLNLLRHCVDTFWHIDEGKIHVFSGNYDDYKREIDIKRLSIQEELSQLSRQKKEMHQSLMKEQVRAAKSRAKGEKSIDQRKWPTVVSKAKVLRAQETSGRKKADIQHKKQELSDQLSELSIPEIIAPKFSLNSAGMGEKTLVSVYNGAVGYTSEMVLTNINFSLASSERLAILGDNGSGKSTLVKAILGNPHVIKSGDWQVPKPQDIGYLDQHYRTLDLNKTVLETIEELVTDWTMTKIRYHLADFLFRQNEEANAFVSTLSGGEKTRLTLAQIAAMTPKLLILDEMTNNLDLETREYVIQVLKDYPGAMIVISHDEDFLEKIGINNWYYIPQL